MSLQIKVTSEHTDLLGDDYVREFHENGGTIGRSLQNDWILPDPSCYVSGRHATIDYKGGMYYLADTSSNGVFVNDESEPIGKGNPRRLFDGDVLRMGDFKFLVSIDSGESLIMPPAEKPSVAPDNIEQFVEEDALVSGVKLLDEEELTGDAEFRSALFGRGDDQPPAPAAAPGGSAKSAPVPAPAAKPPVTASKPAKSTANDELGDAFLEGLGVKRTDLHAELDQAELMRNAGIALRRFVEGTVELLASRGNLKNTFRLDQTTIMPRQNNPLKFSDNTVELLKQLLVGSGSEYLGPDDAVREVCRDLINHQNAFLDAMNHAFVEFAERFDPDDLQDGFDRAMGKQWLPMLTQFKYWRLYRELYPIMTETGGGRFPQMFGEEFVRAYERMVAEYRRHDRDGTGARSAVDRAKRAAEPELKNTIKLETQPATNQENFDDGAEGLQDSVNG